jgi:PKD repeat protein
MNKIITLSSFLFAALLFANGCKKTDKTEDKDLPLGCFTQSDTTIVARDSVTFTNCSTGWLAFIWNFGDGQTSIELSPSHTYTAAGTYTVTLSLTNSEGTTTKTATVVVEAPVNPFPGNYDVHHSCSNGTLDYSSTITATSDSTVTISSFGGIAGLTADATVSGHTITPPTLV